MSAANALATLAARIEAASTSFFTLNNPLYQIGERTSTTEILTCPGWHRACRRGHCEGYDVASQTDCLLLWQGRYRLTA